MNGAYDRPLIGTNEPRHAPLETKVREDLDDVHAVEPAGDLDRQALPGELIGQAEHAVLPAVMGARLDEVIGPHMVRPLEVVDAADPYNFMVDGCRVSSGESKTLHLGQKARSSHDGKMAAVEEDGREPDIAACRSALLFRFRHPRQYLLGFVGEA